MNWEQIEGQWLQLVGKAKSRWGKLTDSDLANVAGKKDQLIGKLQERYGILKEDAETQVNQWIGQFMPKPDKHPPSSKPVP